MLKSKSKSTGGARAARARNESSRRPTARATAPGKATASLSASAATPARVGVFYSLLKTSLGTMSVVFTATGLRGVNFPLATKALAIQRLRDRHPEAVAAKDGDRPKWFLGLTRALVEQLEAAKKRPAALGDDTYAATPLDFAGVPAFHLAIYQALRKIPRGKTVSYAELASLAGSPKAARAVGQAMAKNPLPIVVPCHRVLAANGKLGGFTAPGGLETKTKLLEREDFVLEPRTFVKDFDERAVLTELSARDPRLGKIIKKVGPFKLAMREGSPYEWLLRSIIYQQLHGKAAATIHGRLQTLFGGRNPTPSEMLATDAAKLASVGLSRNKLAALKDLARAAECGELPTQRQILKMRDEEIIAKLLPIRGVGRWTIEMLLIFGLGRVDVLAVDDFALKKSAMLLHGLPEMPNKQVFGDLGEKWRPWRTVASWYLWRALDFPADK